MVGNVNLVETKKEVFRELSFSERFFLDPEKLAGALTHDFSASKMQLPVSVLTDSDPNFKIPNLKVNFQESPDQYIERVIPLFTQAKEKEPPDYISEIFPTHPDFVNYLQSSIKLIPALVYSMYFLKTGEAQYLEKLKQVRIDPLSIVRYVAGSHIDVEKHKIIGAGSVELDGVTAIVILNLVKNAYKHGLNEEFSLQIEPGQQKIEVKNRSRNRFNPGNVPEGHYGNLIIQYLADISNRTILYEQTPQSDGNFEIISKVNPNPKNNEVGS